MSQQISRQRFVGIDVLRTFAILCVVLNHCTENIYAHFGGLGRLVSYFQGIWAIWIYPGPGRSAVLSGHIWIPADGSGLLPPKGGAIPALSQARN